MNDQSFAEWEELLYDSGCEVGCWHEWDYYRELYGADRDGNRGEWRSGYECKHCGATRGLF